jgi:hypothetical protein
VPGHEQQTSTELSNNRRFIFWPSVLEDKLYHVVLGVVNLSVYRRRKENPRRTDLASKGRYDFATIHRVVVVFACREDVADIVEGLDNQRDAMPM